MKYKTEKGDKRHSKNHLTKGAFGKSPGRPFRNDLERDLDRDKFKVIPRSKRRVYETAE